MGIITRCCCGLDVHKKSVVACLRVVDAAGRLYKEVRTFGPMTADLLALAEGWTAAGCTQVALGSPGVYVRRITVRALALAERTGAEGDLWGKDSPRGESQRGQHHGVEAGRPSSRVWSGSARPVG
jgi:hypothetical protein